MAGSNVDYSDLLDAIDFGEIATGVVGAGAALVAVYLAIKGVNIVLSLLKGYEESLGSIFTPHIGHGGGTRYVDDQAGMVFYDSHDGGNVIVEYTRDGDPERGEEHKAGDTFQMAPESFEYAKRNRGWE